MATMATLPSGTATSSLAEAAATAATAAATATAAAAATAAATVTAAAVATATAEATMVMAAGWMAAEVKVEVAAAILRHAWWPAQGQGRGHPAAPAAWCHPPRAGCCFGPEGSPLCHFQLHSTPRLHPPRGQAWCQPPRGQAWCHPPRGRA